MSAEPPVAAGSVAPATTEDAVWLSAHLRPADHAELAALGRDPLEALVTSVHASDEAFTARDAEGALVALFGVASHPQTPRFGLVWMMASPKIEQVALPFLRQCRGWIDRLEHGRDALGNFVDARNALHIKWLRWCGFTFMRRAHGVGPERRTFLEFAKLSSGPAKLLASAEKDGAKSRFQT